MKKRKLKDREKNDHKSMTCFEKSFQRQKQRRQLFDQDEYDIETEILYDSISFVDQNQSPKLDENEKDDAKRKGFDLENMICDDLKVCKRYSHS